MLGVVTSGTTCASGHDKVVLMTLHDDVIDAVLTHGLQIQIALQLKSLCQFKQQRRRRDVLTWKAMVAGVIRGLLSRPQK